MRVTQITHLSIRAISSAFLIYIVLCITAPSVSKRSELESRCEEDGNSLQQQQNQPQFGHHGRCSPPSQVPEEARAGRGSCDKTPSDTTGTFAFPALTSHRSDLAEQTNALRGQGCRGLPDLRRAGPPRSGPAAPGAGGAAPAGAPPARPCPPAPGAAHPACRGTPPASGSGSPGTARPPRRPAPPAAATWAAA